MDRFLFLDRDGTLIVEPQSDHQVDSFEKLAFVPGVIRALSLLKNRFGYKLVMVTNQDGLGTDSFPEADFDGPHNLMLSIFAGEGIAFEEILVDRSTADAPSPSRKPSTGLVQQYLQTDFDRERSFVIGDRASDAELARNMGVRSILLGKAANGAADFTASSWDEVLSCITAGFRCSRLQRETSETKVSIVLSLDGEGGSHIETGIGFFDHMLEQWCKHSGVQASIQVRGDLEVDEHHTVEDTALALGAAFREALGGKRGIERFGFTAPMDESEASVSLDLSGRPYLVWKAEFARERIGELPTELFEHFFHSFCDGARMTLHVCAEGKNEHHKIESIFKAFGRAVKQAIAVEIESTELPSTKGVL